uniref:Uncharacterized protein n=1 Tax=Octopus bimaculoides TaxID=37653 RepID=A0A0L8HLC9_OCTBM
MTSALDLRLFKTHRFYINRAAFSVSFDCCHVEATAKAAETIGYILGIQWSRTIVVYVSLCALRQAFPCGNILLTVVT